MECVRVQGSISMIDLLIKKKANFKITGMDEFHDH